MPQAQDPMTDRRSDPTFYDAYTPAQIAKRVEVVGVTKAAMPVVPLLALSVLAGAFISFGAMFYTVVMTGTGLGLGTGRLLGGISFCLGLILIVVGGAELFTGNVLIVMGWAQRKVTLAALLRNWALVYMGNLVGAFGMVIMGYLSGMLNLGGGEVAATAIRISAAKVVLPFDVAFFHGLLCNVLVCLAVWLCFAGRSVVDKILAILFPITAFVTLGFEHSVANMYFIPIGIIAAADPAFVKLVSLAPGPIHGLGVGGFLSNLIPVTLGNVVGGGVFVALIYYLIYLRNQT